MLAGCDGRRAGRIIQLNRLPSLRHHPERTRRPPGGVLLRQDAEGHDCGHASRMECRPPLDDSSNREALQGQHRIAASLQTPGDQKADPVDPAETDELERRRLLERWRRCEHRVTRAWKPRQAADRREDSVRYRAFTSAWPRKNARPRTCSAKPSADGELIVSGPASSNTGEGSSSACLWTTGQTRSAARGGTVSSSRHARELPPDPGESVLRPLVGGGIAPAPAARASMGQRL